MNASADARFGIAGNGICKWQQIEANREFVVGHDVQF
jgi:hypothetical protein